jgi:hypothetical protein
MEQASKTERILEAKVRQFAGDPERVAAIDRARRFKRSWIELASALVRVREADSFRRWGYETFDDYCTKELHLKRATADKLCASFGFLRANAPKLARAADRSEEIDEEEYDRPIPSWQAVSYVAKAEERGAADEDTLTEMKRQVFDEGAPVPTLSRKFREVAFPMDDEEKKARLRSQIITASRRLADLVVEPEAAIPRKLAEKVEEITGELANALAK